jgi:hypothetical protein
MNGRQIDGDLLCILPITMAHKTFRLLPPSFVSIERLAQDLFDLPALWFAGIHVGAAWGTSGGFHHALVQWVGVGDTRRLVRRLLRRLGHWSSPRVGGTK